MANITPSRRAPAVPAKDGIKHGLPVSSGSLVPLADGLNGLFGWRCLRSAAWTLDYANPTPDTYIGDSPSGISGTARLWLTTSDHCAIGGPSNIGVMIVYQAHRVASQYPSIEVELHTQAGAFRDAIIFDGDPAVDDLRALRGGDVGARTYPIMTRFTPLSTGPSATDAASPTTPRLLNLDAGDERTLMEVRINYANARPLFVRAFEAYREVIAQ